MPTTAEEADKVIALCTKHGLPSQNLLALSKDLHEQVGQPSNNWSVRETMRMLYERAIDIAVGYRPADMAVDDFLHTLNVKRPGGPEAPPFAWKLRANHNCWLAVWCFIVTGHVVVWIALLLSCVLTLLYQPWYLTTVAVSFCVSLLASDGVCPITRWENRVRRKLGWKEVGHFTHWYVICPIFHGRGCGRDCQPHMIGPK